MPYIIAEVGGNHDGDINIALQLIREAKLAGCDAVKFQTYDADKLVHPNEQALPQAKGYERQIDRFRDLELLRDDWKLIINECHKEQIDFLTTCFDLESLEEYAPQMKALKFASGDLTFHRLLRAAAAYGKPVLLSTGMSSIEEIKDSASFFDPNMLTVMHCVSAYPCPSEHANLGVIKSLQGLFSSVGYSDHTIGMNACLVAAGLGCTVIEKHFTHNYLLDYGDHGLSLEYDGMAEMVSNIREIETMLGDTKPDPIELPNRKRMRRGCYAAKDIQMGQVLSDNDILHLRPNTRQVKPGKRATKDYKLMEPLDG